MSTTKSEPGALGVFASLRFIGDQLQPGRLSDILDTSPTIAYRRGEMFKKVRGHEVRGRTGLWLLSSKGRVDSTDLNDHLDYLLSFLFPDHASDRLHSLRELMREDGIEADVGCFWYGKYGAPPPVIRDDIRESFARLPAEIETDFDTD
jgi:hypothetical protein